MLIREYATSDAALLRGHAMRAGADAEAFVRVEGEGGMVVCADSAPPAPEAKAERRMQLLFTGGHHGRHAGEWLFYVGLWAPKDFRDEFLAWYKLEHLPILLECAQWDGCRFVEEAVGEGCQFYAMHQLSDKAALDSAERARSRSTHWFKRLAAHSWFDGAFKRTLCRRVPA